MYISPSFEQHLIKKASRSGFDNGLLTILDDAHQKHNRAFCFIMEETAGNPIGCEFRKRNHDQWAFIVPEMSFPEEGAYRVQYFDDRGFYSHSTFKSLDLAVEEMAKSEFTIPEKGTLDTLSASTTWKKGIDMMDIIRKVNSGEFDLQQQGAAMEEVARKYTVEA